VQLLTILIVRLPPDADSALKEDSPMERIKFIQAALFSAAFAMLAAPALALAQAAPERAGGGGWVLLLVFGALVVAIIWFTLSQRRRGSKNIP
jgi:fatty acid desaturase